MSEDINKLSKRMEREVMEGILYEKYKTKPVVEDLKNLAVTTVGGFGDMAQLGADTLAHLMVARSPKVPFTTERLREKHNVAPLERGQLVLDLLAPGPGEVKNAILLGPSFIKKTADGAKKLAEAAKDAAEGVPQWAIAAKRGLFQDPKGNWREFISDADSYLDMDAIVNKLGDRTTGAVPARLGDVFKHDELFARAPELADIEITTHVAKNSDGTYSIVNPKVSSAARAHIKERRIELENATLEEARQFVLHEVQHIVQSIDNLSFGSTVQAWGDVADEVAETMIDRVVYKEASRLKATINTEEELFAAVERMADKLGIIDDDEVFDLMRRVEFATSQSDEAIKETYDLLTNYKNRELKIALRALEELGEEEAEKILGRTPPPNIRKLLREMYWSNQGEIEARTVEWLRDKTKDEVVQLIKAVKKTPAEMGELLPKDLVPTKGSQTAL